MEPSETRRPSDTETASQLAFPLLLGDDRLGQEDYERLPPSEQVLIERLSPFKLSARYWEAFRALRVKGFRADHAAAGAWRAAGFGGRAGLTQEKFSAILGHSRRWMIRHWHDAGMQAAVLEISMGWLTDRVPAVDEALFRKAELGDVTAIKTFYQRARVPMSGEDAEPVDNWLEALKRAREEAGEEEQGSKGEQENQQ